MNASEGLGGEAPSSGGGTSSLGGSSSLGGTSSSGGTPAELPSPDWNDLVGQYDITLGVPQELPDDFADCLPVSDDPHLNLVVSQAPPGTEEAEVALFRDFFKRSADARLSRASFHLVPFRDHPEVTLDVEVTQEGVTSFTGAGTAQLPLYCDGGELRSLRIDLTVGPDVTAPRVRTTTFFPDNTPYSFNLVGFRFSEPLIIPDLGLFWTNRITNEDLGERLLSIEDAAGAPYPHGWGQGSGSMFGLEFDRDTARGNTIYFELKEELTDQAGNVALLDAPSVTLLDGGPLTTGLDLSEGADPPVSLGGGSTFLASSPLCGSGSCIVVEGTAPSCAPVDPSGSPGFIGIRMDHGELHDVPLYIRYRSFSSTDEAVGPMIIGDKGFSGWQDHYDISASPLPENDGPYTHGTDWKEIALLPSAVDARDKGYFILMGCSYQVPLPEVRLIIDTMEGQPPEE